MGGRNAGEPWLRNAGAVMACDDWHARGGRNAGEPWLRNAGAVLACDDWHAGVAAMLASQGWELVGSVSRTRLCSTRLDTNDFVFRAAEVEC